MRTVRLYLKLGKRVRATIRQLGYPTKNSLKSWHLEYERCHDLRTGYVRSTPKYSAEQKKVAVDHYLETVSKRLFGTSEDVPADERATKFNECLVNIGSTLKANTKTTKIVQPCVSTLDHPAEFAESAAVFRTAPGDHRFDTARTKPLTMWLGVIATICVDDFGLAKP